MKTIANSPFKVDAKIIKQITVNIVFANIWVCVRLVRQQLIFNSQRSTFELIVSLYPLNFISSFINSDLE